MSFAPPPNDTPGTPHDGPGDGFGTPQGPGPRPPHGGGRGQRPPAPADGTAQGHVTPGSGYGTPGNGYGTPGNGYGTPPRGTHGTGTPQGYGTPGTGAPQGYGAPSDPGAPRHPGPHPRPGALRHHVPPAQGYPGPVQYHGAPATPPGHPGGTTPPYGTSAAPGKATPYGTPAAPGTATAYGPAAPGASAPHGAPGTAPPGAPDPGLPSAPGRHGTATGEEFGRPDGPGEPAGVPGHAAPPQSRRRRRTAARGNRARAIGLLVSVLLLAGLGVAGVVWLGSGYDHRGSAVAAGRAGAAGGAVGAEPGSAVSGGPGAPKPAYVPYVRLAPGTCFDSPGLDEGINVVTKVPCDSPHSGEVIADERLTGSPADETALQQRAMALCKPHAEKRLKAMPRDGRVYYNYALYPNLMTYEQKGETTVSCALTLSNRQGGPTMDGPLP